MSTKKTCRSQVLDPRKYDIGQCTNIVAYELPEKYGYFDGVVEGPVYYCKECYDRLRKGYTDATIALKFKHPLDLSHFKEIN
jgi:hypothetical protein